MLLHEITFIWNICYFKNWIVLELFFIHCNSIPFPFIKWNDRFIVYTFVIQEQCGTYSVIVGSHSGQCLDHISCTKHVRTLVSRHRHIQEDNILTVLANVLPRATTAFVIYGMSEDLQPHNYYTFHLYPFSAGLWLPLNSLLFGRPLWMLN